MREMDVVTTQILNGLGWAVIHSLWQGALAALMVVIVRAMTRDSQAALRCGVEIAALAACFTAFIFTFIMNVGVPVPEAVYLPISASPEIAATALPISEQAGQILGSAVNVQQFEVYAPLLGILWCIGFALLALRYSVALVMTQRLRTRGLSSVPADWSNRFRTLVLNAGIFRRVTLHISENVSGPMTLGFFRPIVLVPASFFSGLPACQIEAILLHEIAHIRRHDYLINLVQTAIKTILFYHPAIHYISKSIDDDREQACDDFAVRYTKDPASLAQGLAALRLHLTPPNFALAATGNRKPLLRRLTRLLAPEQSRRRPEHVVTSLAALMVAAGLYTGFNPNIASAHPTDELSIAPDMHVSADHKNYHFATTHYDGRDVTFKIAGNGTRWVNVNNGWYNIDNNPQALAKVPVMPVAPKMPSPDKFTSDVKFAKHANQYRVNLDYYIASLENLPTEMDVSKKLQAAYKQKRRVSEPQPDFDHDYLKKHSAIAKPTPVSKPVPASSVTPKVDPMPISYAENHSPQVLAGGPTKKSGIYIDGERIEGRDEKIEIITESFEDQMDWIEEDFERALEIFEDRVDGVDDQSPNYKDTIKSAEKQLAKAVQKADKARDKATSQFDKDISALLSETISKETQRAIAMAEREAEFAVREASPDMQAAEREIEQELRAAEREREQEMRHAERDRQQALREAKREREHALREAKHEMREAERERENAMREAEHERKHSMREANNQEAYKSTLMTMLKEDGLIGAHENHVDIEYRDGDMYVDGKSVPDDMEDSYCALHSKYDIKKEGLTKIRVTPTQLSISNNIK